MTAHVNYRSFLTCDVCGSRYPSTGTRPLHPQELRTEAAEVEGWYADRFGTDTCPLEHGAKP